MDVIILAAGYATRLYPLTLNSPKPLLEVGGKPIVEHILKKLTDVNRVNNVYIVTNKKFYFNFQEWLGRYKSDLDIKIINDQTSSNDDRLGSLGDIKYVIEKENITDDIMVIAGDNIFEFSLKEMENLYEDKQKSIVALYDVKNMELAKHYGIVAVDENNKMIDFEEKPENPKSTLSSTGIYIYPANVKDGLIRYVNEHGNNDQAGNFLEWLHKEDEVYCYISDKRWIDIGTKEQLEEARLQYGKG